MTNAQTLIRHRDIQNWVADRRGLPALRRETDPSGAVHPRLAISFARRSGPPAGDDGMAPCSWSAWLAELDRQHLALRVSETNFEFVARRDLN